MHTVNEHNRFIDWPAKENDATDVVAFDLAFKSDECVRILIEEGSIDTYSNELADFLRTVLYAQSLLGLSELDWQRRPSSPAGIPARRGRRNRAKRSR